MYNVNSYVFPVPLIEILLICVTAVMYIFNVDKIVIYIWWYIVVPGVTAWHVKTSGSRYLTVLYHSCYVTVLPAVSLNCPYLLCNLPSITRHVFLWYMRIKIFQARQVDLEILLVHILLQNW